jgi:hypothetical protein
MGDLYFHIGLHKTGTTYLQSFFKKNTALLKENGIDFYDRYFRLQALFEPFVEKDVRYGLADIAEEISALRSSKLLVSSENLSHFLLNEQNLRTFREAFRNDTVHILLFLRRQDFLKESIFGEAVKHFHTGTIQSEAHYHYDHDLRIAALENCFGKPFITPHIYHETGDNRLVEKVLRAMGIDGPRGATINGSGEDGSRKNVSPHRRKRLLMSAVPKTLDQTRSRFAVQTTQGLIRTIGRSRAIDDDGIRFLMSPAERYRLVADHLAGNRAIVHKYALKDVGEFLSLPDPEAPWTPPAPTTLREITTVGREAIAASRSETDALRATVRSAQIVRLLVAAWSGRGQTAAPGTPTAPVARALAERA